MDLNGDGHDDVISGQYSPAIVNVWYGSEAGFGEKQTLKEETPLFKEDGQPSWDFKYLMATANFADWDGDGDLDMIVGNVRGGVLLNVNEGTKTAPKFGTRTFLKVDGKDMVTAGKSDPLPVDWDGDGLLDILAGTEAGDVFFYRRKKDGGFEPPVSALTRELRTETKYKPVREALRAAGIDYGYRLRVETADWNGDGHLDLLVGNCFRGAEKKTTGHVYVFLRKPTTRSDND